MAGHELRYDRMVEEALRGVVGKALAQVAKSGLPGDHHFYITFRSNDPGVQIPDHLRQRYPSEMTIVLQHQFWGLEVGAESFSVTLTFSDVPERLTVPYAALVAFADPSVRFGLQFDVAEGQGKAGAGKTVFDKSGAGGQAPAATPQPAVGGAEEPTPSRAEQAVADGAENVVPLDIFRRK